MDRTSFMNGDDDDEDIDEQDHSASHQHHSLVKVVVPPPPRLDFVLPGNFLIKQDRQRPVSRLL